MQKKLLFIFNPKAGKALIKNKLMDVVDLFTKAGYAVTAYPTQYAGDAVQMAEKNAGDYELVVCSGGDGTLDEVVTGLMRAQKPVPLGYIPSGSTNDFAGSLGLPKNILKAAGVAVGGKRFACDVGDFNTDAFVYIAAFGLFTEVSYETPQEVKNVLGHMAYLLEGIKHFSALKSHPMKVIWEDQVLEQDFLFGMVTNSVSVGGFRRITGKYVELDDGQFEVTLIRKPENALEMNMIVTALMNRKLDADCMYCFKASRVEFLSKEEVPWTLDGEYGGSHREVRISNRKQAIEILVPSKM